MNELVEKVKKENATHPKVVEMRKRISNGDIISNFMITDALLFHKNKIWIPKDSTLINAILIEYHGSLFGGHSGVERTFHRIQNTFIWKGMRSVIKIFVENFLVCQKMKVPMPKPKGY